jgi:hypothetical protein
MLHIADNTKIGFSNEKPIFKESVQVHSRLCPRRDLNPHLHCCKLDFRLCWCFHQQIYLCRNTAVYVTLLVKHQQGRNNITTFIDLL